MGAKDGRAPYTRPSDDDQSLEDSLSEEADYYPDVKENALGSIDYNPVSCSFLPTTLPACARVPAGPSAVSAPHLKRGQWIAGHL